MHPPETLKSKIFEHVLKYLLHPVNLILNMMSMPMMMFMISSMSMNNVFSFQASLSSRVHSTSIDQVNARIMYKNLHLLDR